MAGNDAWIRKRFREAELSARRPEVARVLGQLRLGRSPQDYPLVIGALRAAAPKGYTALCASGPRSAFELVWTRPALPPLGLDDELRWAEQWLLPYGRRISAFRECANHVQRFVLLGAWKDAIAKVDSYVSSAGWSLWSVELRAALLQLSDGTSGQRAWLAELQAKTVNSVPGLLFEIFGDRNDDTFSYDAIYGKCMSSFPRFESVAPWLVDYLKYRALLHIENPKQAFPSILSRDLTSSLVDYYEGVVEAVSSIASDESLSELQPTASKLVTTLISVGYEDHRLRKLRLALGANHESEIHLLPKEQDRALYIGFPGKSDIGLPFDLSETLAECQSIGAAARDLVGQTLKWGLNFRGLDVGPAAAVAALYATAGFPRAGSLPLSTTLVSEYVCVHDAAALPFERGLNLLQDYLRQHSRDVEKDVLLKPTRWSCFDIFPVPGPLHLWLAHRVLLSEDYDELTRVCDFLRPKGAYWSRQCAKLNILASIQRGQLDEAARHLEAWFRESPLYALEFPADDLFADRKWAHFKGLDPVCVGLIAHYAYEAKGSPNVGYICKMACRKFLQSGMRAGVVEEFESGSLIRKSQLVAFLRDVWIEQNLAMCHEFESTAQVRVERMEILQLLLVWQQERAAEYVEAIKDLTFDQTLQQGLERIDQSRVFVNESAITRWAEKELEPDYDRWLKLSESSSGGRTVDDMLRQYALDPTNAEVLKEFADGKPTAADALLIDMIDRLFKRFLLDPTDGLDTYLSVRIRHGSLRGTILGPLEEQGLLYSVSGFSEQAFDSRWADVLRLQSEDRESLLQLMKEFSKDVRGLVDEFVDQRIQVERPDKPLGAFLQVLSPLSARFIAASLMERPVSFYEFLCTCYFVYWKIIEDGLATLRTFVSETLVESLHRRVEDLMRDLRSQGPRYLPLLTTLTTASTMSKSHCDTVAEWFKLPSSGSERYQLPDAIEIASVATRNVYRAFHANVNATCLPALQIPLTTSALAVLMDCLFVIFENAWKHSGLGVELPAIELHAEFDPVDRLLSLKATSALSDERREVLLAGALTQLRAKYLGDLPLELIRREGGSGFPKLARLTRSVPKESCAEPFDFGIDSDGWWTSVCVPLYEREGSFEAYE